MSLKESRLANKIWKAKHLLLSKIGLRQYDRAHKVLLRQYLLELLETVPHPTVIETGCIRDANEGTESTLTIASTLMGRGQFYTFEISPEHIAVCQKLCEGYNQHINYIEGDSVDNLAKMVEENIIDTIHFAFFDSVNDSDHIFNEFKTVEGLFKENSIVIADDVLWGDKGRMIKPYLEADPTWETQMYNVEYGMLVAQKKQA